MGNSQVSVQLNEHLNATAKLMHGARRPSALTLPPCGGIPKRSTGLWGALGCYEGLGRLNGVAIITLSDCLQRPNVCAQDGNAQQRSRQAVQCKINPERIQRLQNLILYRRYVAERELLSHRS